MKKISSFMLAVAMIISMAFVMNLSPITAHAAEIGVWDGTTTTQPTSMKTIDGVYYYEIATAEELAYIAKTGGDWLGYNYILANDITLNSVELTYDANGNLTVNAAALNQWTPISNFTGIFNGNDFSISGLYVNSTGSAGLFATMSGSVKNLTIKNAYIKGGNYVGGICGKSNIGGKQISNCTFYGAVIGTSYVAGITGSTDGYSGSYIGNCTNYGDIWSTGGKTGGIIGYASSYTASVSNCINNGTIISTGDNVGGICGSYFWSVYNCTNNGNVTGNNNVGGICGYKNVPIGSSTNHGNITGKNNVGGIVGYSTSDTSGSTLYNTGNVVGESYVGGICGYGTGRDSDDYFTMSEAYNTGDVSGISYVGGLIGYTFNTNVSKSYSTGNVLGTSNTGALIGYSESVWGKGKVSNCYYLKTDTINTQLHGFGNAGDYEGVVRDKKASYFPILSNNSNDPGFQYLGYKNGEIDDPIDSNQQATPPAQETVWDGTILQPSVLVAIDGVYYYKIYTSKELAYISQTGGDWLEYNYILANDITLNSVELTHDKNGNLTINASSLNQWTPINNFTGIFNGNNFSISGLYVNSSGSAGLFATMSGSVKNLTIKNAYVKGGNYVGGICGKSNIGGKQISNCTFYGAVVGTSYVAGITGSTDGYSGSYIGNCTNYGDIFSAGGKTGGIVGYASSYTASISNCINNGTIISTGDNVGGICGSYFWSVYNCTNNGNVTGNNNVGGICGYKNVPIGSSTNHGNITGKNNVGGIVGYSTSDTSGSTLYNTGNVVGESYVGGICGYGTGRDSDDYFTVSEAYNTGDVNGVSYVGGLIGYTFNTNLSKGYSTGTIVGTSNVGALIGYSESVWGKGRVSNCYYLKTDTINNELLGLGNTSEDANSITTAKDLSFFCINADKTLNTSGHTYSSAVPCDATCDNCGYERTVTHTYDNIKYDSDKHWYECDCGEKKADSEASHAGGTATCISKAKCSVCKQSYGSLTEHNFDENAWGYKKNDGHAHVCQTSGCSEHDTVIAHTSSGAATEDVAETCTECGYIISPALGHKKHTAKTEWTTDDKYHWHECTGCEGQQLDKSSHKDLDNNAKCDTCGATVPVGTVGEPDEDVNSDGDGLSGGAIAGIAVGSTAVIGIGGFSLIWFVIKKKSWADLLAVFKK